MPDRNSKDYLLIRKLDERNYKSNTVFKKGFPHDLIIFHDGHFLGKSPSAKSQCSIQNEIADEIKPYLDSAGRIELQLFQSIPGPKLQLRFENRVDVSGELSGDNVRIRIKGNLELETLYPEIVISHYGMDQQEIRISDINNYLQTFLGDVFQGFFQKLIDSQKLDAEILYEQNRRLASDFLRLNSGEFLRKGFKLRNIEFIAFLFVESEKESLPPQLQAEPALDTKAPTLEELPESPFDIEEAPRSTPANKEYEIEHLSREKAGESDLIDFSEEDDGIEIEEITESGAKDIILGG